jgi:lipoprotein NlpI
MLPRICLAALLGFILMTTAHADEADDRMQEALAALKKGDAEAALKAAVKAVELAPERPLAHFYRGEALSALRQPEEAIKAFNKTLELDSASLQAIDRRGGERFKLGLIKESIEDFDKCIEKEPKMAESHWRRGISLYYAGRFEDGAKQFKLGERVYGNDVENAFWHYLCNARKDGVEKARHKILKVGRDRRVPMMKIYDLILGNVKADDVIKTAEDVKLEGGDKTEALFYGHLYVALNYEADGDSKKSLEHMEKAHKNKIGHYMWDVANVHLMLARKKK